ncbi:MAG: type II secretion system protein GspE [Candidatus Rokuibacteriota bacterium]|nr:MAG: type II secretion system protein GspE [Candidatus Rokubacteria bacterium]
MTAAPNTASTAVRTLGQPVSRRLGDVLVAQGLITQDGLARAIAAQKGTSERLGSVLLRLNLVAEEQLLGSLSRQYGVPLIAVSQLEIDPEALNLVPAQIAKKHAVLPIKRVGNMLTLAMADPTDVFALDNVAFMTNLQILPLVASEVAIREGIERHYEGQTSGITDIVSELNSGASPDVEVVDEGDEAATKIDVFELKESADEAPVVKLVNKVLADAIQKGASDIHWESYEKVFRIRFRIDGVLHEMLSLPKKVEAATISRLKIMSNLDIAERRVPQDGRIKLRYNTREIDFRVSVLPTIFGEKAVLRILDKDALQLDLSKLGFDPWALEQFEKVIRQPYGMILITGPTGSGKTTTLYSAIHTINSPEHNIMTAEDPVEYNLKGVNQVQINEGVGRTFASALRAFLRQDPDVILLIDMGVPPFLVASSLLLVLAQRLGRKICKDCKEPYEVDEESLLPYGHVLTGVGRTQVYKGRGCTTCNFTGMKGRVAIYEIMPVTQELRDMIIKGASTAELRGMAQSQGMKTLRQAGLLKVLFDGVTTVEEVLRVTVAE